MSFANKFLTCSDCGDVFTFYTEEQPSFAAQGHINVPRCCPNCHAGREAEQGGGFGISTQRLVYPAIYTVDTEAPFELLDGSPVCCSQCHDAVKSAS
jgi:hypothetical protein